MITIKTADSNQLVAAITTEIKEGKIETWNCQFYNSFDYFTHTSVQWLRKAWLKPCIKPNEVSFTIVYPNGKTANRVIEGIYYGRFIGMLLTHFPNRFSSIEVQSEFSIYERLEKIFELFKRLRVK